MVLARDPIGVRPLLFHDDGKRVAAATTAAELIDRHGVPFAPDEGIAAEVLAGGPFSRRETLVRGIRRVLPGTTVTVTATGTEERVFRVLDPSRVRLPADDAGAIEAFGAILGAAVRCRLRGPGPAALLLSGGLDSGAVALLAGRGNLRAFTVSFRGLACDEVEAARASAAAAGVDIEVIPWERPDPARLAAEARAGRDLPSFSAMAGFGGVERRFRELGIEAVLDGEGGDEILAPSPWRAADLLAEGRLVAAWREARWWGGPRALPEFGLRPFLPEPVRRAIRGIRHPYPLPPWIDGGFALRTGLADRVRVPVPAEGPLGRAGSAALASMTDACHLAGHEASDRWGRRCGASSRSPLLDLRVVEAALALPPHLRSTEAEDRVALRRAAPGITRRTKAEFTPALVAVLRGTGFLDAPRAPLLAEAGWIDAAGLTAAVAGIEADLAGGRPDAHARAMGAWNVFAVETWLREARMGAP